MMGKLLYVLLLMTVLLLLPATRAGASHIDRTGTGVAELPRHGAQDTAMALYDAFMEASEDAAAPPGLSFAAAPAGAHSASAASLSCGFLLATPLRSAHLPQPRTVIRC